MSIYRTLLAVVAAAAITSPVFADDTATTTGTTDQTTMQTTDTGTASATTGTTDQTTTTDTSATTTDTTGKVDLNKANTKDLMKVKGLNASKARAIVAYRKKHGDFKAVEDLSKVKGFSKIKADTMKQITEQVSVN